MRHLTAVHLDATDDSPEGWHYATLGKRGGGPLGNCATHDPHPTEAEARQCYTDYLAENIDMRENSASWTSCRVGGCDNPARNVVQAGEYNMAVLCTEHFDREHAMQVLHLDHPAHDAWQS